MKVTIITANLNGNRFLHESLASILTQDYVKIELVIVDGGSTDGSLTTITDAARDSRVRWISEPDLGIADAMNKGIDLATGDIIGFLHSDDRYPTTDVITSVSAGFANNLDAIWLTGGADYINEQGRCLMRFPVRPYRFERLVRSNQLFHPATFVRADMLRRNRFDADLKLAMDYDLWLRLGRLSAPILLDRPLACFRVHAGSRSIAAADAALIEEFAVRRRFLRAHGRVLLPHYVAFLAKRILNRGFVRSLHRAGSRE